MPRAEAGAELVAFPGVNAPLPEDADLLAWGWATQVGTADSCDLCRSGLNAQDQILTQPISALLMIRRQAMVSSMAWQGKCPARKKATQQTGGRVSSSGSARMLGRQVAGACTLCMLCSRRRPGLSTRRGPTPTCGRQLLRMRTLPPASSRALHFIWQRMRRRQGQAVGLPNLPKICSRRLAPIQRSSRGIRSRRWHSPMCPICGSWLRPSQRLVLSRSRHHNTSRRCLLCRVMRCSSSSPCTSCTRGSRSTCRCQGQTWGSSGQEQSAVPLLMCRPRRHRPCPPRLDTAVVIYNHGRSLLSALDDIMHKFLTAFAVHCVL